MYKFRTITYDCDENRCLLPDKDRLTRLGRFLRATSLDELPELFNVLKGDMSLVGPRPLLMQYLDRYTPEQARRHAVRPGVTGWAQINGRNAVRMAAEDMPGADAIVVLSGGRVTAPGDPPVSEWNDADRFFGGIELFQAGKAPLLVFTDGWSPWQPDMPSQGRAMQQHALDMGVGKAGSDPSKFLFL